jgi:hypothetical protein
MLVKLIEKRRADPAAAKAEAYNKTLRIERWQSWKLSRSERSG